MKPIDSSSGVVCALPTTNEPDSSTMNVSVIVPPASIARTRGLRSRPSLMAFGHSIPGPGLRTFPVMARRIGIVALVLLALLGISQLVIPPIMESRISDRLTAGGGTAHVSVSSAARADPPVRRGQPDRGHRKRAEPDPTEPERRRLLTSSTATTTSTSTSPTSARGPFQMKSFELTRTGSAASYHLAAHGQTTPSDLASYGASSLGLPGGPLLSYFGSKVLGPGLHPDRARHAAR